MTQQDRLPLLGGPAAGTSNSSCYQHQQAKAAALPIPNQQPHQHTQTNIAIPQNGRPPPPHQPERHNSYGSISTSHSIGNNDLLSSFDSLSLSSSYQGQGRGLWSRLATQGTGSTDALSVSSDTCLYPQLPAATGQQLTGQQQRPQLPRYPSVDSNRSGSGQWTAMSESFKHRSDSLGSSCSGRYPAVPLDAAATTLGRSDPTPSTSKGRRYSWDVLEKLQGQQQQPQQEQQRGRQRHRWQPPEGLYPVISGAPCGVQEEQEQQQTPHDQQAPWGFDLQVQLQSVSKLPAAANPYVLVLMHLGETDETYRTEPQWNTQQAQYGHADVFNLANVQGDCILRCEVWDKRLAVEDAMIGRTTWSLAAQLLGGSGPSQEAGSAAAAIAASAAAASGSCSADDDTEQQTADQDRALTAGVTLELTHPTRTHEQTGQLQLKVRLRPSAQEGWPRMQGPVRFRQHLCRTAGALKGHWADEESMCFSTYKLFLCQIGHIFKGVRMPWNKDYDKAQLVFENSLVLSLVQAQHKAMYSSQVGETRGGVLHTAADFFKLFNNGIRDQQPRFFTYTLCADSFRCSETGAAFFDDMCSKHAMHSGGAEEVLYAGEFCIMRSTQAAADFKLVLDNNSGTYSPHKSKLPLIQQLFAVNFPNMEVEVLDWTSAKLAYYQSLCPSRVSPAAAAAAAGAATQAVTFRARNPPQFVAG